jgi:cell division protein YceG involved in septum cleavage
MATVINNEPNSESSSGAMIVGIVLGVIIVIVLLIYGVRHVGSTATNYNQPNNNNVTLPQGNTANPNTSGGQ